MDQAQQREQWKQQVGQAAAALVQPGMVVGLGSGTTSSQFIRALGARVNQGLRITGAVASSGASELLAQQFGIPLTTLTQHPQLDLAIDGADEIDPRLNLIKGGGGALLREKIVASAARRFVVIADATKQVAHLGEHTPLPIEVIPFAAPVVQARLAALGLPGTVRQQGNQPYLTDNGNQILDCRLPSTIADLATLDAQLHAIPGLVATGFFIGIAQSALVAGPNGIIALP